MFTVYTRHWICWNSHFSGSRHYIFHFQIRSCHRAQETSIFRVARYAAKQYAKDSKNNHTTAPSHLSKPLWEQAEACFPHTHQEKQVEHRRGDSRCHTSGPHPHRCSPWHDFSGSCYCPAPPRVTALHPQLRELQSGHGHSYEMPQT